MARAREGSGGFGLGKGGGAGDHSRADTSRALPSPPLQVQKLTKGEMLMVNIGSTSVGGRVVAIKGEAVAHLSLTMPVCTQEDEKVALSRRVEGHWRCVRARRRRQRPPARPPARPPRPPALRQ